MTDDRQAATPHGWSRSKKLLGIALFVGILGPWTFAVMRHSSPEAISNREMSRRRNAPDKGELLAQFDTANLDVGLRQPWRDTFVVGGPHKDSADVLFNPPAQPVGETDLADREAVAVVEINGRARAYPLWPLGLRQIINDTLADIPIAVIYCPLSDTVTVIERQFEADADRTFEFGFSGLLINSNFVFYERQDLSLWSQLGFVAISGPNVGRSLPHRPFTVTTFGAFAAEHPDGDIIVTNRDMIGVDAYECYKGDPHIWYPLSQRDPRMGIRDRVLGVQLGDQTWALPFDLVRQAPRRHVELALPGAASPLTVEIGDQPADIRILAAPADARFAPSFWFMWSAMHPQTRIIAASDLSSSTPATSQPSTQPATQPSTQPAARVH